VTVNVWKCTYEARACSYYYKHMYTCEIQGTTHTHTHTHTHERQKHTILCMLGSICLALMGETSHTHLWFSHKITRFVYYIRLNMNDTCMEINILTTRGKEEDITRKCAYMCLLLMLTATEKKRALQERV
jgi:hypothetical protein